MTCSGPCSTRRSLFSTIERWTHRSVARPQAVTETMTQSLTALLFAVCILVSNRVVQATPQTNVTEYAVPSPVVMYPTGALPRYQQAADRLAKALGQPSAQAT